MHAACLGMSAPDTALAGTCTSTLAVTGVNDLHHAGYAVGLKEDLQSHRSPDLCGSTDDGAHQIKVHPWFTMHEHSQEG